jgi:RNA polymerase sigma factor (sigma-70 family)
VYTRLPAIEAAIDDALAQDLSALRESLGETNANAPDYLKSECLVYLLRDAIRRGDEGRQYMLLQTLLTRCEANLKGTVRRTLPNAEQIREDVLGELGLLFAKDAADEAVDELDYYECSFDSAFRTLRIGVLRREKRKTKDVVPLPDSHGTPDEAAIGHIEEMLQTRACHDDSLRLDELLDGLPPLEREAVVLRYIMGFEISSDDPEKETVATRCGVSSRTIQTRLKQARERLAGTIQGDI